jgi:hypothetical protein
MKSSVNTATKVPRRERARLGESTSTGQATVTDSCNRAGLKTEMAGDDARRRRSVRKLSLLGDAGPGMKLPSERPAGGLRAGDAGLKP